MNQKFLILLLIVLLILLVVGFYFIFKKEKAAVVFKKQNLVVKVEVARTILEQSRGLMGRSSLLENEGMLFVFANEFERRFWMKSTLIPLDLIFISAEKKIVEIKPNFEPCRVADCPVYQSKEKAQYVLEVNGGFCERHGVEVGDEVEIQF